MKTGNGRSQTGQKRENVTWPEMEIDNRRDIPTHLFSASRIPQRHPHPLNKERRVVNCTNLNACSSRVLQQWRRFARSTVLAQALAPPCLELRIALLR